MEFQYRPAKNQQEIEAFQALRVRSFARRQMANQVHDNADALPGAEFFLLLDDRDHVLGGMRMVFQDYDERQSLPSPKRLKLDLAEMFKERGVDISGKHVLDVSGIHVDGDIVRLNPGVMVPFVGSAYRYAREKGIDLMVIAPTKPLDKIVQAVLKKYEVPCVDMGMHEMRWPDRTEEKHVMVYAPNKALAAEKGLIQK
jgi:hypothetical protein